MRRSAGHQLTDYDLQFVALQPPAASDAGECASSAAASEYDFIGSDDEDTCSDSKCVTWQLGPRKVSYPTRCYLSIAWQTLAFYCDELLVQSMCKC